MDRFMLLALAAAEEAITQAGWHPKHAQEQERTATVIASGVGGFPAIAQAVRTSDTRGARRLSPFTVPSFLVNLAAGHISIRHGYKGPIGAPVTACAAGVQAIGHASRKIRADEVDVPIRGGAEACINEVSPGRAFARAQDALYSYGTGPPDSGPPVPSLSTSGAQFAKSQRWRGTLVTQQAWELRPLPRGCAVPQGRKFVRPRQERAGSRKPETAAYLEMEERPRHPVPSQRGFERARRDPQKEGWSVSTRGTAFNTGSERRQNAVPGLQGNQRGAAQGGGCGSAGARATVRAPASPDRGATVTQGEGRARGRSPRAAVGSRRSKRATN